MHRGWAVSLDFGGFSAAYHSCARIPVDHTCSFSASRSSGASFRNPREARPPHLSLQHCSVSTSRPQQNALLLPLPWLDAVTWPVLLGRHTSWVDETVPSSGGRATSAETSKTGRRPEYSCRTARLTAQALGRRLRAADTVHSTGPYRRERVVPQYDTQAELDSTVVPGTAVLVPVPAASSTSCCTGRPCQPTFPETKQPARNKPRISPADDPR
eukprot:COSAG01_NODE_645_length_14553_cov_32.925227_4_plen_214_part_00